MKKTIGYLVLALALMMVTSAIAASPTGFHLDNQIDVTGDWKYNGSWQNGEWQTAQLTMDIDSNAATSAQFEELVQLGAPWHLDYDSQAFVNAPVKFVNELNAITVNPPTTTPGTAWTKVHFQESTGSVFSQGNLNVNGYGEVYIKSTYRLQDEGGQVLDVNIN